MKKKYIKPMVYIESFAINEYIANSMSCAVAKHSTNTCFYDLGGLLGKIFVEGSAYCNTTPDEVTDPEADSKACYHIPLDTTRIFAS